MKKIKLIVDQALDMPKTLVDKYDIKVINLNVAFGDEPADNYTNKEFYEKMRISPILPKTSCPSPDAFLEEYKTGEEDIIVMTLSKDISGTYGSAVLAKEMYISQGSKKIITVIDSTNGSIGSALVAIESAKLIDEGKAYEDIVELAEKRIENIIHYGVLETLENAVKGGRISKTKGFVANVLNLKPIIQIEHTVFVVDKGRGIKNSIKKMIDLVEQDIKKYNKTPSMLGIAHSNDLEKAELVKKTMIEKYDFEDIVIAEIGPIIGTYIAEGGVLLSVL